MQDEAKIIFLCMGPPVAYGSPQIYTGYTAGICSKRASVKAWTQLLLCWDILLSEATYTSLISQTETSVVGTMVKGHLTQRKHFTQTTYFPSQHVRQYIMLHLSLQNSYCRYSVPKELTQQKLDRHPQKKPTQLEPLLYKLPP